VGLPTDKLNAWENTMACNNNPSPADLAKWAADSVVSPSASYDYPKTIVDFIDCTVNPNGTTGGAYFYSSQITSTHSVFCATQCSGEAIGTDGAAQATSAMHTQCVPRHNM
jgi:hypothetical protein